MWTKREYGTPGTGHWTVTNGHLNIDVHIAVDGSGRKGEYPDGIIVSVEQADDYAEQIVNALNHCEVSIIGVSTAPVNKGTVKDRGLRRGVRLRPIQPAIPNFKKGT